MSIASRYADENQRQLELRNKAVSALHAAYEREREATTPEERATAAEEAAWLEYQRDAATLASNWLHERIEDLQRQERLKACLTRSV